MTIIVPAFNAEATLGETLQSVAGQSYPNVEILIIDDGSTDRTAEIAAAFCVAEPRARLIRKGNGGVASARNRGTSEAKGSWLAPVDADDLWHPSKIEKQVAAALAAPTRPGFVYCWFRLIDGAGRVIGAGERFEVHGHALKRLAFRNFVGNGSALLLCATAAREAGGYNESLRARQAEGCEDVALQFEVARRHPVAAVPEYLVGYRFHPGSMSRNADQMLLSWQLTLDRLADEDPCVPGEVLRWNRGIRQLGRAEALANAGKWAGAFRALLQAFGLDPARVGLHLLYRGTRLAARLVRGRRTPSPPVSFSDADPCSEMRFDADELAGFSRLLERFDQARLERLAALESA